jgi:hypothetical protein
MGIDRLADLGNDEKVGEVASRQIEPIVRKVFRLFGVA